MTAPQTRGPRPGEFGIATYPEAGHPVNPRRPRGGRINADDVAHGYAAGRNHRPDPPQPPSAGGYWDDGGRSGCPLTALILLPLLPLLLVAWPLLAAADGWRLGRRHVPRDQMEQDRSLGIEPKRRITADIPDEDVDGYPLGTRPGKPKEK